MDKAVEDYRDAIAAYDAARAKSKDLVNGISKVSESARYNLPQFLAANYGLAHGFGSVHDVRGHSYKMKEWPAPNEIDETFKALSNSFMNVHEAWQKVPVQDRGFLRQPPKEPSTT